MFILSIFFFISSISVTIRRDVSILISRTAIIVLISCAFLSLDTTNLVILTKNLGLFAGLFQISPIIQVFKTFIYILSSTILLLTSYYPRKYIETDSKSDTKWVDVNEFFKERDIIKNERYKDIETSKDNEKKIPKLNISLSFILNKMSEQFRIIEYSLIILLILTGTMFLLSTSDFVSVFLAIELQSYGLYLICSIYKNSELATSAGLTYFLLGGLASCFILLGTALLYSNSANMHLDGLYIITNLSNVIIDNTNIIYWYLPNYIYYSLLILAIGLLFKISAAPYHFWSPDVYDNIPTIVTTFVALIPKLSILIFMLELVHYTGNISTHSGLTWTSGLLLSSFLSLIIGTVLGLTQSRIKRLLAYSTISHLGFILLALSVNSIESNQSFIFYLIQYTVSNLNAFIIVLAMGYGLFFYISDNIEYNKLQDKNNSPIQLTNQLKGYHFLNPVLALSLAISLFSFVGIPPLIGFFAKQMVLSSALDKGYVFLVLTAILTSVIAAVYYLVIIKKMYFDKHEYTVIKLDKYDNSNIVLSNYSTVIISIITLSILLFIFVPQELMNMSNIITLIIYAAAESIYDLPIFVKVYFKSNGTFQIEGFQELNNNIQYYLTMLTNFTIPNYSTWFSPDLFFKFNFNIKTNAFSSSYEFRPLKDISTHLMNKNFEWSKVHFSLERLKIQNLNDTNNNIIKGIIHWVLRHPHFILPVFVLLLTIIVNNIPLYNFNFKYITNIFNNNIISLKCYFVKIIKNFLQTIITSDIKIIRISNHLISHFWYAYKHITNQYSYILHLYTKYIQKIIHIYSGGLSNLKFLFSNITLDYKLDYFKKYKNIKTNKNIETKVKNKYTTNVWEWLQSRFVYNTNYMVLPNTLRSERQGTPRPGVQHRTTRNTRNTRVQRHGTNIPRVQRGTAPNPRRRNPVYTREQNYWNQRGYYRENGWFVEMDRRGRDINIMSPLSVSIRLAMNTIIDILEETNRQMQSLEDTYAVNLTDFTSYRNIHLFYQQDEDMLYFDIDNSVNEVEAEYIRTRLMEFDYDVLRASETLDVNIHRLEQTEAILIGTPFYRPYNFSSLRNRFTRILQYLEESGYVYRPRHQ